MSIIDKDKVDSISVDVNGNVVLTRQQGEAYQAAKEPPKEIYGCR